MTLAELTQKLEARGYLFVTVVAEHADFWSLTAVDPHGYQVEIEAQDEDWHKHDEDAINITIVLDRVVGSTHWDIMFIGEEPFI